MHYHYSFFFSSRRRHTRSLRDWSSDVCSSDLVNEKPTTPMRPQSALVATRVRPLAAVIEASGGVTWGAIREFGLYCINPRSEERRVGKEWRSWRRRRYV